MSTVNNPFPYFPDAGTNGYIYIGAANQDAQTNPITVYRDEALTLPWAQPIRTLGGYPAYQGAQGEIYTAAASWSITVKDANQRIVSRNANVSAMRESVTVAEFGAVGDGTDETSEIQEAIDFACNNDLVLIWPQPASEYVFSGLTFPAGKNVVWRGEGRKRIKVKGVTTDATIGAPTGNMVDIQNFRFQDFLSGFVMDGIATGAELRFNDLYLKNCGRMRNLASVRTDYRAFIQCAPTANKIESLDVSNIVADQGDFAICYRGPLKSASVTHINATNMKRAPVWVGWSASGTGAYVCEFVEVKHCRIFNTISTVATENEIHAIFVNAAVFDISFNYVDGVADINATTHDSEAIYVKGPIGRIEFNTVIDGGRGDGFITSKSLNYSGGPMDAPDSRYGRYVFVSNNVVQKRPAWAAAYGATTSAAYFLKAGEMRIEGNKAYGSFDTFFYCVGGGSVVGNSAQGSAAYGTRFFPSYIESGLGILTTARVEIAGNDFTMSGTFSSVVNVRLSYASGGQVLESLAIRNNTARIVSGATWGGESAYWSVRVDRVASGSSNEIKEAVFEENKAYGVSGSVPASTYRFDTSQGSAGVVGKITRLGIAGGYSDYTTNCVTHSWGSSGDCARLEWLDETHQNVSSELFSGTPANVTTIRVRGINGTYKSENRGTITFNSGDTARTLTTGFRSSMFPATLADSNVTLTIASAAGSTKTLSLTAIDTANRNFTVTADAAPGATMTVNWQVFNRYYFN